MTHRVYDSRSIANYLIAKAADQGGLTALQIMKLVYISHGFVLGLFHRPLLEDDVEAWQYGPVMRRIYKHLPGGNTSIKGPMGDVEAAELSGQEKQVVDDVFAKYGKLSGLFLSNLTHREGSPWKKTWDEYGKNAVIPQDLIEAHYTGIVEGAQAATAAGKTYTIQAL